MISIFIPVYNEEEVLETSVLRVHNYLAERKIDHEIIVGSNGSTDRTVTIGNSLAAQYPWCRFFHLDERGAGRAFCNGVKVARGEFLATLDVDLSSGLTFLDYARDLLNYCDMLVGSKSMGQQQRSFFRLFASQAYILVTQLLFGLTISDYSIGSKAFRREVILPVTPHLDPWTGYIFELVLYLRLTKHRVLQVGIDCDDRRASRFNLLHEGFYRFHHLYRCRKLARDPNSWYHRS